MSVLALWIGLAVAGELPPEPPVPPLEAPDLPVVTTFETEQGISVAVVEDDEQPYVAVEFLFPIPSGAVPAGHRGLPSLTTLWLLYGGEDVVLAYDLDRFRSFVTGFEIVRLPTSIGYRFTTTKKSFTPAMRHFGAYLSAPLFEEHEGATWQDTRAANLVEVAASPEVAVRRRAIRDALGDHVLARRGAGLGDPPAEQVGRDQVVAFHRDWMGAERARLVIVGRVDEHKVKKPLDAAFGDWGSGEAKARTPALPPIDADFAPTTIDEPDLLQAPLAAVWALGGDADVPAVHLVAALLGSGLTGRWNRAVRSELGATYSASAQVLESDDAVLLLGSSSVVPERAGEAIALLERELAALADGVGEAELRRARAGFAGEVLDGLTTLEGTRALLVSHWADGRAPEDLEAWAAELLAVSPERVQAAARALVRDGRRGLAIAGDPARLKLEAPAAPVEGATSAP